jgi:hypothetical protein
METLRRLHPESFVDIYFGANTPMERVIEATLEEETK